MLNSFLNFIFEKRYYIFLAFFKVFVAHICGNCKSWRYRYTNKIHFRQIGTLTTEQVSHVGLALSLTITESINSFFVHNRIGSNLLVIVIKCCDAKIRLKIGSTKLFTIFLQSRHYIFNCLRTHHLSVINYKQTCHYFYKSTYTLFYYI
ncbi:uncharacterized protein BN731_02023 [Prevotella sp. CAG:604]|nr:uncharacterized protein BN731_02023 [Prevotella sp. CAG:604]